MRVVACASRRSRVTLLVAVLTVSCSNVLSFIRPQQTCSSISPLGHTFSAKSSIMKRQAATAIPGGVTSGNVERGKEPKLSAPATSAETDTPSPKQPLLPPIVDQNKDAPLKEEKAATAVAAGEDASQLETKTVGEAKPTAATVGQDAKPSVIPKEKEVSSAAPAVVGTDSSSVSAAGGAVEPVVAAEGKAATSVEKKKKKDGVGPETTAAEKVLTLLEIGLVDREEMAAYYEALSELERTTQEAKVAAAATATTPVNPAKPSASTPFTAEDGPLSLVPFPIICAALGAAGTHALHLTGDLSTATSVFGAVAGATLGALVVSGDDAGGRAARAVGSVVARSAGTAGGAVGKGLSESVGGVAGAAASAVEGAIVKAPANLVAGLASSTSSAVSSAVGSVVSLPGQLAAKAVDGAKGVLQNTSEAVARKATEAAVGALQSTSEAALEVVKETPKEAAKRLKEVVAGPGENLTAFVTRASKKGAGKRKERQKVQPKSVPSARARQESTVVAPSKQDTHVEPEGIPAEELEAKLLSVRKALERFDDVKNRIEEAHTSDTLKKTVGMTRSMDMAAEREKGEQARAAAQKAKHLQVESEETPDSRPPPSAASKSVAPPTGLKATDQDRMKQVAARLLEKASQRATEAKTGLKAAAESARREADLASIAAAAATGAEQKASQEAVASR